MGRPFLCIGSLDSIDFISVDPVTVSQRVEFLQLRQETVNLDLIHVDLLEQWSNSDRVNSRCDKLRRQTED